MRVQVRTTFFWLFFFGYIGIGSGLEPKADLAKIPFSYISLLLLPNHILLLRKLGLLMKMVPALHAIQTRGGYNSDDITKVGVGGRGGAVKPGGSDDGMTITITISSGSSGTDDSKLQAILARCAKK